MTALLVIAAKDLRQRFRDRSALVLGFVAPVTIATLMSFAFQGSEEFRFTMGLVDQDGGAVAAGLVEVLGSPGLAEVVDVERLGSPDEARQEVDGGGAATAVVIPNGFSQAATSPGLANGASLQLLTDVDRQLAAQVTRAIVDGYLAQVNANRLSVAAAIAAGVPAEELETLVERVSDARLPEQVLQRPSGSERLRTVSYYAPAMGIFFVLFAVGFAARGLFAERKQGTLERIAMAPVPRRAILAGKAASVFVYAVASLSSLAVVTSLAFGADWGHPVAAAMVIAAVSVSVLGLTALVATLARNERQADGLSSVVVFTLALLGGNFVFISAAPPALRALSLLTPNGWALRAFTDMATTRGGLVHDLRLVAGPLLAILVFTLVAAAVAAALTRRLDLR